MNYFKLLLQKILSNNFYNRIKYLFFFLEKKK